MNSNFTRSLNTVDIFRNDRSRAINIWHHMLFLIPILIIYSFYIEKYIIRKNIYK